MRIKVRQQMPNDEVGSFKAFVHKNMYECLQNVCIDCGFYEENKIA